jgi:hypothetical protein
MAADQLLQELLASGAGLHMGHDEGFVDLVQRYIKQPDELFGAGT